MSSSSSSLSSSSSSSSSSSKNPKPKVLLLLTHSLLRLHDNAPLATLSNSLSPNFFSFVPVYVIDHTCPFNISTKPTRPNKSRSTFILQTLKDLDASYRKLGSRLVVLKSNSSSPLTNMLSTFCKSNEIDMILHERHPAAPNIKFAQNLLDKVKADSPGIKVQKFNTVNLHDLEIYLSKCPKGVPPSTMGGFQKIFESMNSPRQPLPDVTSLPPLPTNVGRDDGKFDVPTLEMLGYNDFDTGGGASKSIHGGESAALALLKSKVSNESQATYIATFSKPHTSPNSLLPSTTTLSPYITHGCLSPRLFYHAILTAQALYIKNGGSKSSVTVPPVSLKGQLLWRDFNYLSAYTTPSFDAVEGNPLVRRIDWDNNPVYQTAWQTGRTGYPYIDAIQGQLSSEGWIHHLARHSTACFFTRGDLYQSWTVGASHFEVNLIDADWCINNFNWQWLSCSNYYYQYFKCYSPVSFGQKGDKEGAYVSKYCKVMGNFPAGKWRFEPFKAPASVVKGSGVRIGKDLGKKGERWYPSPIVEHSVIVKTNMGRLAACYSAHKVRMASGGSGGKKKVKVKVEKHVDEETSEEDDDDDEDGDEESSNEKEKKVVKKARKR